MSKNKTSNKTPMKINFTVGKKEVVKLYLDLEPKQEGDEPCGVGVKEVLVLAKKYEEEKEETRYLIEYQSNIGISYYAVGPIDLFKDERYITLVCTERVSKKNPDKSKIFKDFNFSESILV